MTDTELRSISGQTVEELGGPMSLFVRQRSDHVRLNRLLTRIRDTTGDAQDEAITDMCRLVFAHAFAEEAIVWPAIRRQLPDGEELTVEVEREHQEINELIAALDRSHRDDPDREELLDRAFALLDEDVRDEEDELFPRLQQAVDRGYLQRLGMTWELVRRTAPTRPHPVVARRPPGNVISALPLSAIDRTRDGVDRLARRGPDVLRSPAEAISRSLAAVAGAVEQLPPMRAGEDPSTHSGRTERES